MLSVLWREASIVNEEALHVQTASAQQNRRVQNTIDALSNTIDALSTL
jgi:hypothetical protein